MISGKDAVDIVGLAFPLFLLNFDMIVHFGAARR
jgi:hypothetical protein